MKLSFQSDAVAVDVADVAVAVAVAVAQSEQVQGIIATSNIGSTWHAMPPLSNASAFRLGCV